MVKPVPCNAVRALFYNCEIILHMNYRRNEDKICLDNPKATGVSFNQYVSVELAAVVSEPVTLTEAKNFCKIDVDEDDQLLEDTIIPAARAICEEFTNISFVKRNVKATINNFNGNTYLPYGHVEDVNGNNGDDHFEFSEGVWKQIISPRNIVTVEYEGGYDVLPAELKIALLNQIYYLYDNRSSGGLSPITEGLLLKYRRV